MLSLGTNFYIRLGLDVSHQIIATKNPTSYSIAEALPAGVVLNGLTGVISVALETVPGNYEITVTATNSYGSDTKVCHLIVGFVPEIIGDDFVVSTTAGGGTYQIETLLDNAVHFGFNDFPTGLSMNLNSATGLITNIGGVAGVYVGKIFASNDVGTHYLDFTITITA